MFPTGGGCLRAATDFRDHAWGERSCGLPRILRGWLWLGTPVFENEEITFYQMNGFVLGTWLAAALEQDSGRAAAPGAGAYSLAHNVSEAGEVRRVIERLLRFGGRLLRGPDAPPHGGFRGYVADPDDHAWEIAWNPLWPIDAEGHVRFAV